MLQVHLGYLGGTLFPLEATFTTTLWELFSETLLLIGRISRLNIQDANLRLNHIPKSPLTEILWLWRTQQPSEFAVMFKNVYIMFLCFEPARAAAAVWSISPWTTVGK